MLTDQDRRTLIGLLAHVDACIRADVGHKEDVLEKLEGRLARDEGFQEGDHDAALNVVTRINRGLRAELGETVGE